MHRSRTRELFRDSDCLVMVIETVRIRQHRTNKACAAHILLEPTAVIVCNPGHSYALNSDAQSIEVEPLLRKVPELDAMIKQWGTDKSAS